MNSIVSKIKAVKESNKYLIGLLHSSANFSSNDINDWGDCNICQTKARQIHSVYHVTPEGKDLGLCNNCMDIWTNIK